MGNFITAKTGSPAGDLISFMAGFKQLWKDSGKRVIVYQRLNVVGAGTPDSIHPFHNSEGDPICMPEQMFYMLRPLLLAQEYVEDYRVFMGEQVDLDMDQVRLGVYTNQPRGSLNRYYSYVFPQMASDLSKSWISAQGLVSINKPIYINFTQRYRNYNIQYFWLKEYQDKIQFMGLEKERDLFCKEWDLNLPLVQVDDFHQLAVKMSNAKLFMGNQSFCFQLAEALKVPRILETFPIIPNVIPIGEHAYDFYHQKAVEYYFAKLLNM